MELGENMLRRDINNPIIERDTKNVTFVNGARYVSENKIEIYYGAADSHVARAFVDDVDQFIKQMEIV